MVEYVRGMPPWHGRADYPRFDITRSFDALSTQLKRLLGADRSRWLDHTRAIIELALGDAPPAEDRGYWRSVIIDYTPELWDAGRLRPSEQRRLVLSEPQFIGYFLRGGSARVQAELRGLVRSLIEEGMRDGRLDPTVEKIVSTFPNFAGIDDFTLALRAIGQRPERRADPWTVAIRRKLLPPSDADVARAAELACVDADALVVAGVLCPVWATIAAAALPPPEADGLIGLAQWIAPYFTPPWDRERGPATWDGRDLAADRAALRSAVVTLGQERLRHLLADKTLRWYARSGLFAVASSNWNGRSPMVALRADPTLRRDRASPPPRATRARSARRRLRPLAPGRRRRLRPGRGDGARVRSGVVTDFPRRRFRDLRSPPILTWGIRSLPSGDPWPRPTASA
jgi:hypothetical protein